MSLLLSTLETTVVSTSLASIVSTLNGLGQSGWVVTGYFLTYTLEGRPRRLRTREDGELGCPRESEWVCFSYKWGLKHKA